MNVIRSEFPWSPPLLHYKTTLFLRFKIIIYFAVQNEVSLFISKSWMKYRILAKSCVM